MDRNNSMGKIQKIRIQQWCNKLMVKSNNIVWRKNNNFYLKVLYQMITHQKLMQPFLSVPNDGPLPNLSLYSIPYPIRQIFQRRQSKQKAIPPNSSQKQQHKQLNSKDKSIRFNEDLFASQQRDSKPSKIHYRRQSKAEIPYQKVINSNLKIDFVNQPSITCKKSYKNKYNYNKNSQNNKNYSFGKNKQVNHKVQNDYSENDKENNPYILNNQAINRKLFKSKEKEVNLTTMATEYTTNIHQKDYQQLDQSSIHQIKSKNIDNSISLLSKIYHFFNEEKQLLQEQGARRIVQKIKQIGNQMGIQLNQQNQLDSSIISQKSKALRKASENIKLKFEQTSIQTMQFMDFLQNVRNKNIK